MFEVSVGVPAYNEEASIGRFLQSLLGQRLKKVKITEILVVASGCTDKTVGIVRNFQKKERRIKLFEQGRRLGKTAADNLFFRKAKGKILVLAGADTVLKKDCLEKLVTPFLDPKMGLTGARIVPLNDTATFPGYFSHFWWRLWHQVALDFFRAGELLAFRRLVRKIPQEIGADEVFLTDAILAQGYKVKYVPEAVVYNLGLATISDIIRTRRRHACLHFQFSNFGPKFYYPKTMDNFYVLRLFLKEVNWLSLKEAVLAMSCAFLEALSRFLAWWDYLTKKDYQVWERNESTKRLTLPFHFKNLQMIDNKASG